jgi:hypothetical protein
MGIDADIDEMCHAVNQGAGLARAGPGDNQKRTFYGVDGLELGGVELFAKIELRRPGNCRTCVPKNVLFDQESSVSRVNYLFSLSRASDALRFAHYNGVEKNSTIRSRQQCMIDSGTK